MEPISFFFARWGADFPPNPFCTPSFAANNGYGKPNFCEVLMSQSGMSVPPSSSPGTALSQASLRQPLPQLPPQRGFGQTERKDLWWLQPVAVFLGLGTFVVYSTWAAFQNGYYLHGNYLSPFYSPEIFGDSPHAWFGPKPGWWPSWMPFSPALLILWAPGGFRFTFYYYRGAYYKAFWADPSSCGVGEPRKKYLGEHSFPLILQNIHRYFVYLAVLFLVFLAYDVYLALWFDGADGKQHLGLGLGTLIMAVNVCLLSLYTFGCHSLRHLIGGWRDTLTKAPMTHKAYNCIGCLNRRHMLFAWCSLCSVGFTDLYIRMCAMGKWTDLHWSFH